MSKRSCTVAAAVMAAALLSGVAIHTWRSGNPSSTSNESVVVPMPERRSGGVTWPSSSGGGEESAAAAKAVADVLTGAVPTGDLVAKLRDVGVPLRERRRIAWVLAQSGDPGDFRAVTDYLSSGEGELKVMETILEALGGSPVPEAGDWLRSALQADDGPLVAAALRGLGRLDRVQDIDVVAGMLQSDEYPPGLRGEAAMALGMMSDPAAGRLLMERYGVAADEDMRGVILSALGQRDIAETGPFFRGLMREGDEELRMEVLAGLSEAKGNVAAFLLDSINDPSGEVRAEAVWSLSMLDGDHARELSLWLQGEQDSEVRTRIYQALAGSDLGDVSGFYEMASKEDDPAARMAGYALVAGELDEIAGSEAYGRIRGELVGYFEKMALSGEVEAVQALKQMDGDLVEQALKRIAAGSSSRLVIEATGVDQE